MRRFTKIIFYCKNQIKYNFSISRCFTSQSVRKPSYFHYVGRDPLVYRTIGQQLDLTCKSFGEREALISCHEKKRLTFLQLRDKANELAAGLVKIGLHRGDRLGIWSPNNSQWLISMLAAANLGLISVGLNPAYQGPEIEYCLKKVDVKAIIMPEAYKTQNYYEILLKLLPEIEHSQPNQISNTNIPSLKSIIVHTKNKLPGVFQFDEVCRMGDSSCYDKIVKYENVIQPDSPCNIQFTSGTTGHPKATTLSHFHFVNNGIHTGSRNELSSMHHKICMHNPFFHAFGVIITIMSAMTHGATIVLPGPGFNPEDSLNTIASEKCTIVHGTPTMYVDLVAKQKEKKNNIKTLQIAITGGAPCSPQLFSNIKDILGVQKIKTVFGMTETTAVIFQSLSSEDETLTFNTVGHIQDHTEAKVIDENGDVVPFGQPGELCIRGYTTMLGYYKDEKKTKEMIGDDKWLKTGDQFILEENGYGKIVGRLKDMIIRGGENIFPKEVEDYMNTHPNILETQVIGVPDERMGEELCAYIRIRDSMTNITHSELKEFCKGNISHFKVPRYLKVVKDFPKTNSGKIQKFKLLEMFKKSVN